MLHLQKSGNSWQALCVQESPQSKMVRKTLCYMILKQAEVTEHQSSNSQSIAQLSWLLPGLYDTFCH